MQYHHIGKMVTAREYTIGITFGPYVRVPIVRVSEISDLSPKFCKADQFLARLAKDDRVDYVLQRKRQLQPGC